MKIILPLLLVASTAHADLRAMQQVQSYYAARDRYVKAPAVRRALVHAIGAGESPDATAKRMYGSEGARIVSRLRSFGPGFDTLVSEPGLVTRLSQFKRFLNDQKLRDEKPEVALAKFRAHLGTTTVYRALALGPGGEEKVAARGLESRLAMHELDVDLVVKRPASMRVATGPTGSDAGFPSPVGELVKKRLLGFGNVDEPLVSVTRHRDVAIAATSPFARDGKQIHLYTAQVPVLDTFHMSPKSRVVPRTGKSTLAVKRADGTSTYYPFGTQGTESFLLYRIDPKEIVKHEVIDAARAPSYEVLPRASAPAPREQQ